MIERLKLNTSKEHWLEFPEEDEIFDKLNEIIDVVNRLTTNQPTISQIARELNNPLRNIADKL